MEKDNYSKIIWQSKDKHAYCMINASGEIWIDCPGPLDVDELRNLEYSINLYLQGKPFKPQVDRELRKYLEGPQ